MNNEVKKLLAQLVQHLQEPALAEAPAAKPRKYALGQQVLFSAAPGFYPARVRDLLPDAQIRIDYMKKGELQSYTTHEDSGQFLPMPEFLFKTGESAVYKGETFFVLASRINETTGDKEICIQNRPMYYDSWVPESKLTPLGNLVMIAKPAPAEAPAEANAPAPAEAKQEPAPAPAKYQLGDEFLCRDTIFNYERAKVIGLRKGDVRIHYIGFEDRYDEWIPENSTQIKPLPQFKYQAGDIAIYKDTIVTIRTTYCHQKTGEPFASVSLHGTSWHENIPECNLVPVALKKDSQTVADFLKEIIDEKKDYLSAAAFISSSSEKPAIFNFFAGRWWKDCGGKEAAPVWEALLSANIVDWPSLWSISVRHENLGMKVFLQGTSVTRHHLVRYMADHPEFKHVIVPEQLVEVACQEWNAPVLQDALELWTPEVRYYGWSRMMKIVLQAISPAEPNYTKAALQQCIDILMTKMPEPPGPASK